MQVNDVSYLERPGGRGCWREKGEGGGGGEEDGEVAVEILDMRVGPTLSSPGLTPTARTFRGENNA